MRVEDDCVAVGPSYGRFWSRFQGINFREFETFRGDSRVVPSLRGAQVTKQSMFIVHGGMDCFALARNDRVFNAGTNAGEIAANPDWPASE